MVDISLRLANCAINYNAVRYLQSRLDLNQMLLRVCSWTTLENIKNKIAGT